MSVISSSGPFIVLTSGPNENLMKKTLWSDLMERSPLTMQHHLLCTFVFDDLIEGTIIITGPLMF